jgi:hypothetical protein
MIVIAQKDPDKNEAEWNFFHGVLWGEEKNDPGIIFDLLKMARRILVWRSQATATLTKLQKASVCENK